MVSSHLKMICASMRLVSYDSFPLAVRKKAETEGINIRRDRVVIFRYGQEAEKIGYGTEANVDFYGCAPSANVPGHFLQVFFFNLLAPEGNICYLAKYAFSFFRIGIIGKGLHLKKVRRVHFLTEI